MVNSGKKNTYNELFDPAFYAAQCQQEFATGALAWKHYLTHGVKEEWEPAPYFLSKWYRWQNPDCQAFSNVLDHFVIRGAQYMIDPSPFVDLTQVARLAGVGTSVSAYHALIGQSWTEEQGVFESYCALEKNQTRFFKTAMVEKLFDHRTISAPSGRKRLVWVQIGPGSEFLKWFDHAQSRSWDLLCNWYAFDAVDLSAGEIGFAQKGTKFTAVAQVLKHHAGVFDQYDQILFLDDDLIFAFSDIDKLFQIAENNDLSLFQASLTENSYCVWPDIKKNIKQGAVPFNTVEIMMPGFSKKFLLECGDLFSETISGFGLDLALGKLAGQKGLNTGVIYDVKAQHLKPINESSGAYYDNLRLLGINPKLELWRLIEKFSLDNKIRALGK